MHGEIDRTRAPNSSQPFCTWTPMGQDGDSVPTGVTHILKIGETEGEGPKDAVGQMEIEKAIVTIT